MDPNNGQLYPSWQAARDAGVENPVEISGRLEDVQAVSAALKAKAKRKAQKKSRRANR